MTVKHNNAFTKPDYRMSSLVDYRFRSITWPSSGL